MAQHIPTKNFKQKAFRTIENGIDSAFSKSRGLMKSSMRYQYLGIQGQNEVYTTTRRIPKGIVWNMETACIEIHFDPKKKIIEEIYLVA